MVSNKYCMQMSKNIQPVGNLIPCFLHIAKDNNYYLAVPQPSLLINFSSSTAVAAADTIAVAVIDAHYIAQEIPADCGTFLYGMSFINVSSMLFTAKFLSRQLQLCFFHIHITVHVTYDLYSFNLVFCGLSNYREPPGLRKYHNSKSWGLGDMYFFLSKVFITDLTTLAWES
ncbi:hypothetical protein ACJX0J_040800, partial [Zea mays]